MKSFYERTSQAQRFDIEMEMRYRLIYADGWARPVDKFSSGWTGIKSIRDALDEGLIGLALDRWDDYGLGPDLLTDQNSR